MNDRSMRFRLAAAGVVLMVALMGLGCRLASLHLGVREDVRTQVARNRTMEKEILAGRGSIYDRQGKRNILAMNLAVKNVCTDPHAIIEERSVVRVASDLAEVLNLPADRIAVQIDRYADRQYTCIERSVRTETAHRVRELGLPGVFLEEEIVRYYPQRAFMCHVLGFVNREGIGSAGVEQGLDRYLQGTSGWIEGRVNAFREELYVQRSRHVPALEGASVQLTLDQNVQYIAEKALDRLMQEHRPKGAWAIVQRVPTGEILAMANRPAYDLNDFCKAGRDEMLNRAIGCVYEPGSTFKVLTFAAALNEGSVTPGRVFDCENGAWAYNGRVLHDYHAYDRLTAADGLKKSSNILAAKVALTLDEDCFYHYLRAFGVGSTLGIDLPGEERGLLRPPSSWSAVCQSRIAMGQGVAVTALQMLGILCAIGNDGFLMRPYVVHSVTGRSGTVLLRSQPEVLSRPISAATSATMRTLLRRVTEKGGTGWRARVDGYTVAGKTGSAQKAVNGRYPGDVYVASFAGFVPATDPEIGVIVVVDEPQPLHTGGRVAAPAFAEIAGETVRYLDVPPTRDRRPPRLVAQR